MISIQSGRDDLDFRMDRLKLKNPFKPIIAINPL